MKTRVNFSILVVINIYQIFSKSAFIYQRGAGDGSENGNFPLLYVMKMS